MKMSILVALLLSPIPQALFALECRPLVENISYRMESDRKTKYRRDPVTLAPPVVSGAIGEKLLGFLTDPYLRTDNLRIIVITKKKPNETAKRDLARRWSGVRVIEGDQLPGRAGLYRWVLDGNQDSLGRAISMGSLDAIYAEEFGTYRDLKNIYGPNNSLPDLRDKVGVSLTLDSIGSQVFYLNLQQQRVDRPQPNWSRLRDFLEAFAEVGSFELDSFKTPTDATLRIAGHIGHQNPGEARVFANTRTVKFEGRRIILKVSNVRNLRIILQHPLIYGFAEDSALVP